MKNPFVAGSWVRGERFFGRGAELLEVLEGPRRFLWVMGTRRVGKTSFLKQLEYLTQSQDQATKPAKPHFPLFWDLAGSRDLDGLRASFLDAMDGVEDRLDQLSLGMEELEALDLFGMLRILKRRAKAAGIELLLLCDECEELINVERRTPEVLPKLRRVLQEGEVVRTVLAATKRLSLLESNVTPETSPFLHGFVPPVYLARLTDAEAAALIQQGAFDAAAVQEIQQKADNHPYLIQLVAKRFFETGKLSSVIEEICVDDMVSKFFSVDFEYLSAKEKDVVLQVAQGRSQNELEARQGVSESQMQALVFGLQQMGYIRQQQAHYSIANYFFEKWLQREMGVRSAPSPHQTPHRFGARSLTTLELADQARAGDRQALELLRSRYDAALRRWASARVPHCIREQLETDVLIADVFQRAVNASQPHDEGEFWERLRQGVLEGIRQATPSTSNTCPQDEIVGRDTLDHYESSLGQLGNEHRRAVVMRIEMGCTYDGVAAALGKPTPGAARMTVCFGLLALAQALSGSAEVVHDEQRFIGLARSIADGSDIEWQEVLRETGDSGGRSFLAGLQSVARIAWFHRTQQQAAGVAPNADAASSMRIESAMPPPQGASAPAMAERWGHLEMVEKIGAGVFGDVYRALDTTLNRTVALKLLRVEVGADVPATDNLVQHLLGEARNLARVRHANVVTIYGAEQHDGRIGIWMEFIRGMTLEQLLGTHGTFGGREAALIGIDLCRALTAVHRAEIVHRDIKANNVMREEGGRIVLMDFGTGAELDPTGLVNARGPAGTPVYLAPEIFRGERATLQSDLYSLGVLLFHLVTGAVPVDARSLEEIAVKHERGDVRLLREINPDLPELFVQAVEKALAPAPASRFPTAGKMEQALVATLA